MKKIAKFNGLMAGAAPVVLGFALLSAPAYAQDEAPQEIIVTGTLISNPNLQRATPVLATTSDQIELKQNNTAEEILREVPGIVPSIGSAVNNGNGGASFADLRGLGSNRNVVLLDGVRLVPAELQGRFDLNNVPLALIERVDVLTGGASTTYGADAISGVVNFITKSDFAGLEANASQQITQKGDGNIFRLDVTLGANFDDGRGNVVLSVGYQQADPVYQGDRSFSVEQVDSFTGQTGGSGTSSPTRFSGLNVGGLDAITTDCGEPGLPDCAFTQGVRQVTADGLGFRPDAAYDAFNFNPYNVFQTPFERYNVYAAGRYEVSDAVEVYSRGIFSKNTVETVIAPSGAFGITIDVPLNNPFLTAAQRNAFCAFDTNPGAGYSALFGQAECDAAGAAIDQNDPNYRTVSTSIFRRATEFGPRVSEYVTTFFDYRLGARGGITDSINWDVFGSYGESENIQTQKGYWLNSRVRQAVLATNPDTCIDDSNGCVPLNIFGPDGSITPEMNQFLNADSLVINKFSMSQVRAMISGDVGVAIPMASDAISFAVGGEYRKYTASQESDLLSRSGDLGGAGGAAPNINGGYDVYEAIGEVVMPLVQDKPFFEDLTLEAGVRYSKYSIDAPSSPSYETWTWKAGGSWTPMDGVKLRGNYARAVRAPNIYELFSPITTALTNLSDDPCASLDDEGLPIPGRPIPSGELRAICIAQGAPAGTIGSIPVPASGQSNYTGGGSVDLGPEKSSSYTVGVVLQPRSVPGFSMTVDYYNIKVKNALTSPNPGDAINECFGAPDANGNYNPAAGASTSDACTIIRRSATTGALSGDSLEVPGLYLPISNRGRLATDGIDVTINYDRNIGFADWALGIVGNWTNKSVFQANEFSVARDCVGLYSGDCASIQPQFQWSVRNTLSFEDVDVSFLWRHIDRVEYEYGDAFVGQLNGKDTNFNFIPAYDIFDLSGRFHVSDEVTLTATVSNLFNKQPKVVGNNIGSTSFNSGNVYPSTYDALGRRFAVSAKFRF